MTAMFFVAHPCREISSDTYTLPFRQVLRVLADVTRNGWARDTALEKVSLMLHIRLIS
jgi:hypothetical protein